MATIPVQTQTGSSVIPDPIKAGLQRGWKVTDCSALQQDQAIEADVAIIGSGAGGGVTAEILTLAGLNVVILEEGPLKSSSDFKMREAQAYPTLYQEGAARKTRDKTINILQGRTVGGTTVVNWTSSFRTPEDTLNYWQSQFGLKDYSKDAMAPWFDMMEQRLHVAKWEVPPNENNSLLAKGSENLGVPTDTIRRNVNGCWNLGYCGMGCPTNAKQSMLVTTIPSALDHGARLLHHARAWQLAFNGDQVDHVVVQAMAADGMAPTGKFVTVRAKHYVLAGGAINNPGLLLRSKAPDPHGLIGRRTFLHPTIASAALFEQKVEGYSGAPQSVYSDHFLHRDAVDGPVGYKLEVPPQHPVLMSTTLQGFGQAHADMMRQFPHVHTILALLRDGFNPDSVGGTVGLNDYGLPVLHYPITPAVWDGVRRALLTMAEIQFAAGAKSVLPVHEQAQSYTSWEQAKAAINALPMQDHLMRVVSAHVMGGCGMASDPSKGVVDGNGRYFGVQNLSVHDGSLFPTSIGANPQLSIYGVTARLASRLAESLGKQAPRLNAAA
ncbi:GMC family oxidoreductase [Pseudoduganella ginsengisoli]|uniref:long-chain-alcohol oxidase n=1 Tax=Pseudoduganella ginsengisoli TaxID=1462440 RepID=A0A6L6Q1K0_9BURK|nr:GMC family oxidoreductase [Pseudoduganella ginsengisoli]MTW03309.1 GMC family oxidoreductase [Pseudoduganella ginsengisoli]